jgi:hypothetical protein
MIHQIAYGRGGKEPRILAKCGQAVNSSEARAFDPTCPDCQVKSAWPSNDQQKAAGFTGPGGKGVFDKLMN